MNLRFPALAATAFAALGCYHRVSTNASLIDPSAHFARTCPTAVKLYTVADRVQQPYREVALLTGTGATGYSNEGELIESMREKAAKVGANGIILAGIDEPSAMEKIAGQVAQTAADAAGQITQIAAERKGRAMAIYVSADSLSSVEACKDYKAPSRLHRWFGL